MKETTKRTYKEGKLLYKEGAHEIRDKVGDENVDKVQTTTKDVAHNIKHYGAFGEDVLGYSDPQKELRKAVKAKEKAAKEKAGLEARWAKVHEEYSELRERQTGVVNAKVKAEQEAAKAIAEAQEGGHIPGLGPAESQYNSSGYSADSNFKIDMFVLPSPSLNRAPTPITIAASTSKKKKTSIRDLRGQLHVLHHY